MRTSFNCVKLFLGLQYIDTQKYKIVVNIELPGGGSFEDPKIIPILGYYSLLDQDKQTSLNLAKNLRKKHPIHIQFKISSQIMQLKYVNNEPEYIIE